MTAPGPNCPASCSRGSATRRVRGGNRSPAWRRFPTKASNCTTRRGPPAAAPGRRSSRSGHCSGASRRDARPARGHGRTRAGCPASRHAAAYVAAKFVVVGLTPAAARDFDLSGIRVEAACAGYIRTLMVERVIARDPDSEGRMIQAAPAGRLGTAEGVDEKRSGSARTWRRSSPATPSPWRAGLVARRGRSIPTRDSATPLLPHDRSVGPGIVTGPGTRVVAGLEAGADSARRRATPDRPPASIRSGRSSSAPSPFHPGVRR